MLVKFWTAQLDLVALANQGRLEESGGGDGRPVVVAGWSTEAERREVIVESGWLRQGLSVATGLVETWEGDVLCRLSVSACGTAQGLGVDVSDLWTREK